jgi:hypothetical protein
MSTLGADGGLQLVDGQAANDEARDDEHTEDRSHDAEDAPEDSRLLQPTVPGDAGNR